ncbi:uncharacterized protein [Dermacentor andersoni]|uniref:uncharacterized protein isoform X2 n=1 Tax=Dermacentor andersoni TaxID=34620 RepID=UPI0024178C4D|nr:uncharacterized protein LOC126546906 isoform X3 [Dermacentor andersoni]
MLPHRMWSKGLTNAMSLGECITDAKVACHTPSKVISQVEVGIQCRLPLADKSVGCSFKAGSESRSVQTTETVNQSSSTSVPRIVGHDSHRMHGHKSERDDVAAHRQLNGHGVASVQATRCQQPKSMRRLQVPRMQRPQCWTMTPLPRLTYRLARHPLQAFAQ